MRPALLFDMDGTLIDSAAGMRLSLNYALTSAGLPTIAEEEAGKYLGPPLEYSLTTFLNLHGEKYQKVWDEYARHYRTQGYLLTFPVTGMPELCGRLNSAGFRLAIATCKPWAYCQPTLKLCRFPDCFEVVSGSFHNGVPEEKSAVIREALRLMGLSPAEAVMIGDRASDVTGARECGLPCIGVDFCGYAEPHELENAGAEAILHTVGELEDYLLGRR